MPLFFAAPDTDVDDVDDIDDDDDDAEETDMSGNALLIVDADARLFTCPTTGLCCFL